MRTLQVRPSPVIIPARSNSPPPSRGSSRSRSPRAGANISAFDSSSYESDARRFSQGSLPAVPSRMSRTTLASELTLQGPMPDDDYHSSGPGEDCEQASPTARIASPGGSPRAFASALAQEAVYVVRRRTTDDGTRSSVGYSISSGCPSPTSAGNSHLRHAASAEHTSMRHSSPGGYNDSLGLQTVTSCPTGSLLTPQRPGPTPHRLARTGGGASACWDAHAQPSIPLTPVQTKSRTPSHAGAHPAAPGSRPQSLANTPRSSCSGSVAACGSPRDWGQYTADAKKAMRKSLLCTDTGVVLPEVDQGDQRVRMCGRMLLSLLFLNLAWMELQDWHHQMPWELDASAGWALLSQLPPWGVVLTLLSIGMLLLDVFTPLVSAFLASRLALTAWERRSGILAALGQTSANLLPAKELAVAGSLVLLTSYTYQIPASWLKRSGPGRYSGLEYCKAWAPGKTVLAVAGHLLVAPLFLLMLVAQLRVLAAGPRGPSDWWQHFTALRFWWPLGDGAGNNWMVLETMVYLVQLTGISRRRVPMLLSFLLLMEAFTCWRWWSGRWVSRSYIAYIRRHFTANVALAGGLLLALPSDKVQSRVAELVRGGSSRKRL